MQPVNMLVQLPGEHKDALLQDAIDPGVPTLPGLPMTPEAPAPPLPPLPVVIAPLVMARVPP
jgi:hypothetical protein